MYGAYSGTWAGLTADDIAGIRSIYGTRTPDVFDAAGATTPLAPASALPVTLAGLSFRADLTSRQDVDYYRLAVPAGAGGATFTARTASHDSLSLRPVLVLGTAGWESKFTIAALDA